MPVDTSSYNAFLRPVKSAMEYAGDYNALADQQVKSQTNALALQQAQQGITDDQAVRKLYAQPGFDPSSQEGLRSLTAVSPTAGMAARKFALEAQKTGVDMDNTRATTAHTQKETEGLGIDQNAKRRVEHLQQVVTISDLPGALKWTDDAVKSGELTQEAADQMTARLRAGAIQLPEWKQKVMMTGMQLHDQMEMSKPNVEFKPAGGSLVPVQTNPYAEGGITTSPAGIAPIPVTQSPDSIASNATSRANNSANITKDYKVAGLDAKGNDVAGDTSLSPAAIENAAARYNVDGTMPTNIGRGTQGARDLRKIQNRAAELALGVDPTQVRVNQLDAKSSGAALTQLTKAQTMAGSFEQTANANADLALGLSKKNDRTGIPLLNAGIQAWRTGTGSPEATQFAAANETFVNEYAKIMSGGMGNGPVSDSARNKAHSLLSTAMTPQQYEGNVKLLQTEMRNRMKGFDDQTAAIRKRIGGGKADAPAAPADDIHAKADAILRGGN